MNELEDIPIWKLFQSEPYHVYKHTSEEPCHVYKHTSESCQELLDSRFYYGTLVILLLYTVSSVASSCISIKVYLTDINKKVNRRIRNWSFHE